MIHRKTAKLLPRVLVQMLHCHQHGMKVLVSLHPSQHPAWPVLPDCARQNIPYNVQENGDSRSPVFFLFLQIYRENIRFYIRRTNGRFSQLSSHRLRKFPTIPSWLKVCFFFFFLNIKNVCWDPAGVAQWIEHWPANQRVAGSIPSQGTCLCCGPGPL